MDATTSARDYELGLLGWEVVEPINGGTDWYVTAAFEYEADALAYAEWRNSKDPTAPRPFEARHIGTAHHPAL
jgi:hypothetical protein